MVRAFDENAVNAEEPIRLEDEMDAEELERFRAELKRSHEQAQAGEVIPFEEVLEDL